MLLHFSYEVSDEWNFLHEYTEKNVSSARNVGESGEIKETTQVPAWIAEALPVEKPVDSVHNFLYIMGVQHWRRKRAEAETKLSVLISCLWKGNGEASPSNETSKQFRDSTILLRNQSGLTSHGAVLK